MSGGEAVPRAPKKRWGCLVNGLLVVVSTLLTLLLLDAGIRMVWRNKIFAVERRPDVPQVYRFPPGMTWHGPVQGDMTQPRELLTQSWIVDVTIDPYGYRNQTIPAQVDTILLGDSFGALPVSQPAMLASRLATCDRSVYNLSVPTHSPWQEYATLILEQDRLNIQPGAALIWMLFSGNDLDDPYLPVYGDAIKTELTHQDSEEYISDFVAGSPLLTTAISVLRPQPRALHDPKGSLEIYHIPYLNRATRTAEDIRAHPNYPLLHDTFKAMAEEVSQHQLKPLVVIIPSKEEVYYYQKASGFGQVVGELAAQNGMDVLDLTPEFLRRAGQGELLYFMQDTHWNEYAQQIVTGLICKRLGWAQ